MGNTSLKYSTPNSTPYNIQNDTSETLIVPELSNSTKPNSGYIVKHTYVMRRLKRIICHGIYRIIPPSSQYGMFRIQTSEIRCCGEHDIQRFIIRDANIYI